MKKRVMALLMAATMMVASLVGCGSSESTSGGASGSQRTVADVKAAGKLTVGAKSDSPSMGMINTTTGEYEGFEIDLAYEIAGKIFGCTGEEAKEKKLVEFTSVTAKTRGGLLDNGELDCVIAAFTITEERKKSWNFTEQYRLEPVTFLVSKASGVKTLADMDGFIIGVGQGTTTAEAIKAYAEEKGIKTKYTIQDFNYITDGVAALKTGQIDAYSVDRAAMGAYVDENYDFSNDAFGIQDIGIALKKGNDELTKFMDDVISELRASGRLDEMKRKWGALTDADIEAIR